MPINTNGADDLWRHSDGTITTYAKHEDMGLWSDDELDALVVFDDGDKKWGEGDTILFSLARNSPTLADYNWTAADVLVATYLSTPGLYSPIDMHGLERGDELNALGIMRNEEVFGADKYGDKWLYSDIHPFILGKKCAFAISFFSGVVIDFWAFCL